MKVLFVMRHSGYVRNFESTLRMLCDRGHHVHLAFQGTVKYAQLDPADIGMQLSQQYPRFSYGRIPLRTDAWGLVGRELHLGLDYLRYLTPPYRSAPKLRKRARRAAPLWVIERAERGLTGMGVGRRAMTAWLRGLDRAIPPDTEIDAFIREISPDVLALTPLIEAGAPQVDYVRSARALGVPVALCVASWDNLTNKGLIHGPIDLVTVWNETMKREAVELHGVPAPNVVVTGAVAFDHWFDWRPSTTREAFCSRVGLPPDRPYLLYVCSSRFVAPEEVPFVRTWVEQIRQSTSGLVRDIGILVRPHPQHAEQWRGVDLSHAGPVVVWPPEGAAPVDPGTRNDYFDSMHHSAAVVGINTTAEIESAILGRPVCTLLASEFRDTQEGTLHFHHLRQVNGGLLQVARDFDEHLAHLDRAVREPDVARLQCKRFVEAFVRPHGADRPATPRLVDALEQLARSHRLHPEHEPLWTPLVRRWLARRGAQLEREARALLELKAAQRAVKDARATRRRDRVDTQHALAEESREKADERRARRSTVQALARDFHGLTDGQRQDFLRAAVGDISVEAFVELNATAKPQKLDYERADIYVRVATKGEMYRLRACAKEPFTIDWIHRCVGAGEVMYDIGANVGAYSLVAAKQPGGGARVFCFEPSYGSVASLCANIVLNDLVDQVTPMPIALSDATAMNVFRLRDLRPGAAGHTLGRGATDDGPALYEQPVMTFRLDDAVELFRLPQPNHIKLDVDGGEMAVLEGGSRTLSSPGLHSILIEVSTSLSATVTHAIERHGLRLESRRSVKNKAGEYLVWYGLFVRGDRGDARLAEG